MICLVEQIKKLCSDNETSIKALEKELGFGNGTIRRWDTNAPSVDKIILVANRFNVPVSSITGTVEQKEKPTLQMESELSPIKQEAWELIQKMDEETLMKFIAVAKALLGNQ